MTNREQVAFELGYKKAQSETKHGKWISHESGYMCSTCHKSVYDEYKYCPNCGEKMDVEKYE